MNVQDFKKYAQPRVKELGTATYEDYYGDEIEANVLMIQSDVHGVDHMKVMENDDDEYICLDPETNELLIETEMISPVEIALRLEFDYIDPSFYNYIVDYWDDLEDYTDEELDEAVSSGVYSLQNGWVKRPSKQEGNPEDVSDEVAECTNIANGLDTIEEIDAFFDDIYKLRQESLLKDGEFGRGNLIFKELRNNGILDNLKDKRVQLMNKLMSLGER